MDVKSFKLGVDFENEKCIGVETQELSDESRLEIEKRWRIC
jgi:hypothetical protein